MNSNKTVSATFGLVHMVPVASYTLTTSNTGTGSGIITGNTSPYITGTTANLTATAATGSTFTGWTGACTGKKTCVVNMNTNKSVTATFKKR